MFDEFEERFGIEPKWLAVSGIGLLVLIGFFMNKGNIQEMQAAGDARRADRREISQNTADLKIQQEAIAKQSPIAIERYQSGQGKFIVDGDGLDETVPVDPGSEVQMYTSEGVFYVPAGQVILDSNGCTAIMVDKNQASVVDSDVPPDAEAVMDAVACGATADVVDAAWAEYVASSPFNPSRTGTAGGGGHSPQNFQPQPVPAPEPAPINFEPIPEPQWNQPPQPTNWPDTGNSATDGLQHQQPSNPFPQNTAPTSPPGWSQQPVQQQPPEWASNGDAATDGLRQQTQQWANQQSAPAPEQFQPQLPDSQQTTDGSMGGT